MNITYEQYQAAKALIEQYEEYLRYGESGDDEDFMTDEDFYEEQIEQDYERDCERAATCKCGAWVFNKNGDPMHIADCCCRAE